MDKKGRLLDVLKLLREETDDDHKLSTNEIIEYFAAQGIHVNRKTVKDDMDTLEEHGYDILTDKSSANHYALGERELQEPELRLLMDAVAASRLLTEKKTEQLQEKLISFVSRHRADTLRSNILFDGVKMVNEQVYIILDRVNEAIAEKKQIRFHYYDYGPDKKRYMRHNGEWYVATPYALIWSEDQYYLFASSERHEGVTQYRVDRMDIPEKLDIPAKPQDPSFNINDYAQRMFKMFNGNRKVVRLLCENDIMKSVIDRFGENVDTTIEDDSHFSVRVTVTDSPTFYSWVFQFGRKMRIVSPQDVVAGYEKMLRDTLEMQTAPREGT